MTLVRSPVRTRALHGPETWARVKEAFAAGMTAGQIKRVYGVNEGALRQRSYREGWTRKAMALAADAALPPRGAPPVAMGPIAAPPGAVHISPGLGLGLAGQGAERAGPEVGPKGEPEGEPEGQQEAGFDPTSPRRAVRAALAQVAWLIIRGRAAEAAEAAKAAETLHTLVEAVEIAHARRPHLDTDREFFAWIEIRAAALAKQVLAGEVHSVAPAHVLFAERWWRDHAAEVEAWEDRALAEAETPQPQPPIQS